MNNANTILHELETLSDVEKKRFLPYFFKTGKGEYGEGDQFLGVVVPRIREVVKCHKNESFETISALLSSKWHEVRLCALLMMVENFQKSDDEKKEEIYRFYLSRTSFVNNWDLVDLSAPGIVGAYLLPKGKEERRMLYLFAKSGCLWKQRIAVVSTIAFIRKGDYNDILCLAELLMYHPHDLIHKSVGWMLREVGKRDETILKEFLDRYASKMPRTMLRYSIEKFDENIRQYYLKKH